MNIKCTSCQSILKLDENRYTQDSVVIQCPKCSQKIRVAIPKNSYTIVHDVYKNVPALKEKPFRLFSRPFSLEGRIRRSEFVISTVFSFMILGFMQENVEAIRHIDGIEILIVPCVITLVWFMIAQGAQRCHDLGRSGWYQLIPFYVLWLLFEDGSRYENEYGESPKYEEEPVTAAPVQQPVEVSQVTKETNIAAPLLTNARGANSVQTSVEIQNIDYLRLEAFIQKLQEHEHVSKIDYSFNDGIGNLNIKHQLDGYKLLDEIRLSFLDLEVLSLNNNSIRIKTHNG